MMHFTKQAIMKQWILKIYCPTTGGRMVPGLIENGPKSKSLDPCPPAKTVETRIRTSCRFIWLFSSPEHNVLRGSYCDRSSSVRPSVRSFVRSFVRSLTISLKIFSSKTRRPILIKLGRNVPWVKLYKNC